MPPSLTLAFVMDPVGSLDIEADTTFVLMLEAQERGHDVLYIDPANLCVFDGRPAALATPVKLAQRRGAHAVLGSPRVVDLDEETHAIFQRKDPPVDEAYMTATQILSLCRSALVFNRPSSVLVHNEKLVAIRFSHLMPPTVVSRHIDDLREFIAKQGGEAVIKPLGGKGGEGIFLTREGDENLSSILELSTAVGTRPAMIQRYLPAVRDGDKRILLLDGEPLGAVLRVPADSEVRANLHVGGRAAKTELDADDLRIVEVLGPAMREEGLFFVGIDVIGGLLTEINVTSPTGMQEINSLDSTRLETRVIEAVEEKVAQSGGS